LTKPKLWTALLFSNQVPKVAVLPLLPPRVPVLLVLKGYTTFLISNRSIIELHVVARNSKSDEMVYLPAPSFRTSVVWSALLCGLHRLKVMASCETAAAVGSESAITSEEVIQLLRQAQVINIKNTLNMGLIFQYLCLVSIPSSDLAFMVWNVNAVSQETLCEETVPRSTIGSPAIRVYESLIRYQPTFRFSVQWGVDSDCFHFLGTLGALAPYYVPGDQVLCIVKC
jgi:hypothetical protein